MRSLIGNGALVALSVVAGCGGEQASQLAEARVAFEAGRQALERHREHPSKVNLDRAVAELERAAELAPAEAEIRYWAGLAREALVEHGPAQAHYRAAVESAPGHANAHGHLGSLLLGDGQLEAARVELERALQLGSREPEILLDHGRVLEQLGDDAGARAAYELALEESPTFDDAHYRLSQVLRRTGDEAGANRALAECYHWQAAGTELSVALELARAKPGDADAAARVGVAAFPFQRAAVATAWLDRALSQDAEHAVALQYRGMLYHQSGELNAADRLLTASVRAAPERAEAHRELGFVRLAQGRGTEAAGELQRAVDLEPGDAEMRFQQGVVLLRLEQLEASLAVFDQALVLDPQHIEARLGRAEVLYGMGESSEAAEEYRRVLQLDPGNEGALSSLAFLAQESGR